MCSVLRMFGASCTQSVVKKGRSSLDKAKFRDVLSLLSTHRTGIVRSALLDPRQLICYSTQAIVEISKFSQVQVKIGRRECEFELPSDLLSPCFVTDRPTLLGRNVSKNLSYPISEKESDTSVVGLMTLSSSSPCWSIAWSFCAIKLMFSIQASLISPIYFERVSFNTGSSHKRCDGSFNISEA
jgi:hypothetical protein